MNVVPSSARWGSPRVRTWTDGPARTAHRAATGRLCGGTGTIVSRPRREPSVRRRRRSPAHAGPAAVARGDRRGRRRPAQDARRAAPLPQHPRDGGALHLPADRGLRGGGPLPRCRRGDLRRPVGAFGTLRGGAVGPRDHPLRRRRHVPPLLGDVGPRVDGHRRDRGRGPGPTGLRAGAGGRCLRPGALGALPPRLADGQAGADRDGDLQGDDVLRLRRGHRGPRGGMAGLRGARVVVVGAGEMGLGVCRALSDIEPSDAPRRVVVVNRSAARANDLVRSPQAGPSRCDRRRWSGWRRSSATPTSS